MKMNIMMIGFIDLQKTEEEIAEDARVKEAYETEMPLNSQNLRRNI